MNTDINVLDDLRNCMLFSNLDDATLERIADNALRVTLREGENLFVQGDPAVRFFIACRGQIKLFNQSPTGDEKVLRIITPGQTFGEALLFLNKPCYPVSAQALKPAEVIGVDSADFAAMLHQSVDTCFVLLGTLSQRLHRMLRELSDLTLYTGTCRVAAHFVQEARNRDALDLEIPKQVVASRLSIRPETFSRILKNLSNNGIISVHGRHVTISDRPALLELASVCNSSPAPIQPHQTDPR